ncbi:hypothetical protein GWK47_012343 [Chionoecetes opilio]|uniref:Uncharacterized protein n=1 Tax=Chionoecetes opilio TaxID=41210 RepID=A0A8J5C232_CHIOP|nr:hypothetical protein GWK47_012343 [Chionoecetes opilio]
MTGEGQSRVKLTPRMCRWISKGSRYALKHRMSVLGRFGDVLLCGEIRRASGLSEARSDLPYGTTPGDRCVQCQVDAAHSVLPVRLSPGGRQWVPSSAYGLALRKSGNVIEIDIPQKRPENVPCGDAGFGWVC